MKTTNKRSLLFVTVLMLSINAFSVLQACRLLITNDTDQIILIVPLKKDESSIKIEPGDVKNFGQPHQRAHFTISIKDSSGSWVCQQTIQQHSCSPTKDDIQLNVSALLADPISEDLADLFNVYECPLTID